jgi:hypothetical protein
LEESKLYICTVDFPTFFAQLGTAGRTRLYQSPSHNPYPGEDAQPQGLKAKVYSGPNGTAKAVPVQTIYEMACGLSCLGCQAHPQSGITVETLDWSHLISRMEKSVWLLNQLASKAASTSVQLRRLNERTFKKAKRENLKPPKAGGLHPNCQSRNWNVEECVPGTGNLCPIWLLRNEGKFLLRT